MDGLSNFVGLEPTESCTAASTTKQLLRWYKIFGVPEVWVSDTVSHFKNRVMKMLEGALRVEHRFAVTNSRWSDSTCKRMMREVVGALKAILQEERRDIREWVGVVPVVSWALNSAYRERYARTPYHVMFGWAPLISSQSWFRRLEKTGKWMYPLKRLYGGRCQTLWRRSKDCTRWLRSG